ncbi:GIGYF family protein Gyf isoform X2 [Coccinella septempunctata]|uniref:GIGYF family protein Gyf isoform X2 n=1 Tax=Coccinella septempunctata TaxID=41139 RepID=UPI001D08872A|nr:GIGYF family protein Gyf isoform X2 [Coccinella septempunctata]
MTDSMNFGPDWIRNLSSEGTTTGNNSVGKNYQLADYRYGREEMLALFDKNLKPPESLVGFRTLFSETTLFPLALVPNTDEERGWQSRPSTLAGSIRGRVGPLDRGGRVSRGGRGGYQNYARPATTYDGGWGTSAEQTEWSPRKEYNPRGTNDNWRRNRLNDDDDGWRNLNHARPSHDKWGRSSWRGGDGEPDERIERHSGNPDGRVNRMGWNDGNRNNNMRRSWDEDHLPEWAMANVDGGGTFDSTGAFHNSDEEPGEGKSITRKETVLQKSSSQQHITPNKGFFSSLQTSKSVASLSKTQQDNNCIMKDKGLEKGVKAEIKKVSEPDKRAQSPKHKSEEEQEQRREKMKEIPNKQKTLGSNENSREANSAPNNKDSRVEDDFKIQEDSIIKLVDDDSPKAQMAKTAEPSNSSNIQPPPNLGPPIQDQWFYQDPQGQMQGPFSSAEMAEWYKAGYFNSQLKVRRPCDELFYLLGELVALCDGANPFLGTKRFAPLKPDPTTLPEPELLQYQYLMALRQAQTRPAIPEPWNTLTLQQQQEVAAQRLIMHPQVSQELPYIHQSNTSNPLMHMINQMQQANKLPNPTLADKAPTAMPNPLDPRLVQLSNLHQLQNRLPPTSAIPNPLASRLPGLTTDGLNLPGVLGTHPLGLTPGIGPSLGNSLNMPRQMTHNSVVDNLVPKPAEDPISSLLKQLHQQKQQQQQAANVSLDTLWQSSQYTVPQTIPTPQWQQEPALSMWDINKLPEIPTTQHEKLPVTKPQESVSPTKSVEKEKSQSKLQDKKDEVSTKELKKKKEQEEKQAKKEAEEKRKNEQRRLEAEKRAAEEKKRKEEEKIKKEIEKAKKEAEEKRLKELEEKRKLKEQRKAEEEARKKTEEQKKAEEERAKKEAKEREEYAKKEAARLAQEQAIRNAKIAPWCQSSSSQGLSLQEIQKLEKEKARQEALILQQQKQMQELQQQQEKAAASFTWAAKAKEQRQVKSLAEIQAEEQERLAKQAAEAKLLAMQKEKELPPVQNTGNIWNSQNLSWSTNNPSTWSYNNNNTTTTSGLWEEVSAKPATNNKPSNNSKGSASNAKPQQQQQQTNQQQSQKAKPKSKKEEPNPSKNGATNSVDEFTNWCTKALSNITSEIDIPTFVTFLKDIESAMDVRDYCKEYLGDNPQTLQFASNFLEKRRSFRPKNQAPKDDMCSPASAINPSSFHSNEFQEVKGKNKKNKKNKMLKVDNRILGFNVTSAPDRINVGDRDYGDNS